MTPRQINEWLVRVAGPVVGILIASYLILTRAKLEAYDITLIVMFLGLRWVGRGPSEPGS